MAYPMMHPGGTTATMSSRPMAGGNQFFQNPEFMQNIGNMASSLFGRSNYKNPAETASPYYDQIPGVAKENYTPFVERGARAGANLENEGNALTGMRPELQTQIRQLMQNPGNFLNTVGQGYQESPGVAAQKKAAMDAASRVAAAGGMRGSPMEQEQVAQSVNDIVNQDYNTWMNQALGLQTQGFSAGQNMYGKGLGINESLNNTGYNASNEMAQSLMQALMSQGNLAYAGQGNENEEEGDFWGSLLSGAGKLASSFLPF